MALQAVNTQPGSHGKKPISLRSKFLRTASAMVWWSYGNVRPSFHTNVSEPGSSKRVEPVAASYRLIWSARYADSMMLSRTIGSGLRSKLPIVLMVRQYDHTRRSVALAMRLASARSTGWGALGSQLAA